MPSAEFDDTGKPIAPSRENPDNVGTEIDLGATDEDLAVSLPIKAILEEANRSLSTGRVRLGPSRNQPPVFRSNSASLELFYGIKNHSGLKIECTSGPSWAMSRAPKLGRSLENSQDFGGVQLGEDGKVKKFAVADGVGSALASRSVAEIIVNAVLNSSNHEQDQPNKDRLIDAMLSVQKQAQNALNYNEFAWLRDVQVIGSSTLIFGVKHGDKLHIAQLGDGGWAVITPTEILEWGGEFEDGKVPGQIAVGNDPPMLDPNEIKHAEVSFPKGAICLVFTDGLLKSSEILKKEPDERVRCLAQKAQKLLREGKTRKEIVQILITEGKGLDDCFMVLVENVIE
jgi:hypothetical protein